MERKEETRAVKSALREAGITVVGVKHGRGTAWGWLHVKIGERWRRDEALRVVQAVTGRRGEYDGRVSIEYDFN